MVDRFPARVVCLTEETTETLYLLGEERRISDILRMIATLGGMVGCEAKAAALIADLQAGMERVRVAASAFTRRPRVYFEEWDAPQISGIRWVSQLVGIAGGDDCFPAAQPLGKDRIIADPLEVVRRAPEVIFGSWCGKKFRPDLVAARPGWADVPAVRDGHLYLRKVPGEKSGD